MPIVTFARAVRRGAHVIITAYGESGCGKTYSLIKLGRGLVGPKGRLGMLDTETGRGMIYASIAGGYDYAELSPPFTPERYIEAIDAAEEAGIDALIIDSGSHEWEGMGGILEIADGQTSQSGQPLQGLVKWAKPKARHKRYVQRLLNSRMHLLLSLRAKEKMMQLDKPPFPPGMKKGDIISAGFVPIQDKRFIFETTVQLFLPIYGERNRLGVPVVEKCPEDLLGAFPEGKHISEETGRKIAEWVDGGVPVDHAVERLKRDAEAAAAAGTEALREYWRGLDKTARERLRPQVDNLGSIAGAADQAEDERRSERESGHRGFRRIGDNGGGDSGDDADPSSAAEELGEEPFGLPPLEQASPQAGERPGEDRANISAPVQPPRQGEPAPSTGLSPRSTLWADPNYRLEPSKLPDGMPNWPDYSHSLCFLIGEASAAEIEKLRTDNREHLNLMRRQDSDSYRAIAEASNARLAALRETV